MGPVTALMTPVPLRAPAPVVPARMVTEPPFVVTPDPTRVRPSASMIVMLAVGSLTLATTVLTLVRTLMVFWAATARPPPVTWLTAWKVMAPLLLVSVTSPVTALIAPVPVRVPAAFCPAVMAMKPPVVRTPLAPIQSPSASTMLMLAVGLLTLATIVLTLVPSVTEFCAETVSPDPVTWLGPLRVMAPLLLVSVTLPLPALTGPVPLREPGPVCPAMSVMVPPLVMTPAPVIVRPSASTMVMLALGLLTLATIELLFVLTVIEFWDTIVTTLPASTPLTFTLPLLALSVILPPLVLMPPEPVMSPPGCTLSVTRPPWVVMPLGAITSP